MKLELSSDVKDLKGKVIVSAGADVMAWSKKALLSKDYLKDKVRFKDIAFLMDDCRQVFSIKPYDKVLKDWTPDFRAWVGETWAPRAVFEELRLLKTIDLYSYQHVLVITVVGSRLLEFWIQSAPTLRRSFQALICHRLGKTRMMEGLLSKEGPLDETEKRAIFEQPIVGFVLNAAYWGEPNHLCAKTALQHQEDRAGKGYPLNIKTNSLVLDVLRLLDRFDALISQRPFRFKKFTPRQALDILKQDAEEARIEMDVVRAFLSLVRGERPTNFKAIPIGEIGREELS
ncbi:MAG: hypothetical protein EA369_09450 [Bradymonadales bacterium]|nr:MAG: hypothetical protein EA369_09450 [Bradymonadales bacterium]